MINLDEISWTSRKHETRVSVRSDKEENVCFRGKGMNWCCVLYLWIL